MVLILPSEAQLVRDTADFFFDRESPVRALRAQRDRKDVDCFSRDVWRSMAELGWPGFLVPEAYGGSEFGISGLAVALEAAGRRLTPSPLFSTALLGASALVLGGSERQKTELLPVVASGEHMTALALDTGPHHRPEHIVTHASRITGGWRLNGTKDFVMDGGACDTFIVVARKHENYADMGDVGLLLVPATTQGITVTRHVMVDSRNVATVELTDVVVNEDAELRGQYGGSTLLHRLLDRAYIGLAAEGLGVASEAFERTIAFLKQRHQFGVPIGSFQALKHRAALMFCELELLRSAVRGAIEALEADSNDSSALASAAKAKACDALRLIANESIQMHGGIGVTDEHEIGFFLKRARVLQLSYGSAPFHRDRYSTLNGL